MIEIDAQPTTNNGFVPTPKPSEIVRNWPDAMWGGGWAKRKRASGEVQFCAIGVLGETGGHEWGRPWCQDDDTAKWDGHYSSAVARFVGDKYGLSIAQLNQLIVINDSEGKEAAADLLASWGL